MFSVCACGSQSKEQGEEGNETEVQFKPGMLTVVRHHIFNPEILVLLGLCSVGICCTVDVQSTGG